MVNTKSMTQAKEQAKAEQAKTNAKIAELTQIMNKVVTTKLKMSSALMKLKMALPDYMALKDEVGEELERDAMAVVIQRNWPKLEASSEGLEETMA